MIKHKRFKDKTKLQLPRVIIDINNRKPSSWSHSSQSTVGHETRYCIAAILSVTGDWIVHATHIQPSHQEDRAGSTIGKTTRQRIIGSGSGLEYLRRMYLRPSESAELDCV
ncbi:uncharacterized protein H6S33_001336 [Morchella sextelata]|uniref:uncharacterized protein n=1 Tax=Morchella sextelata TaxID=1174677 RepID=UPI001D03E594|nr:uncharacterized protein H6S33_001336 [Morchella sextelata]KAH0609108.1 hypothetical protein H6S33_001336 [Morchella sextelata]